MRRKSWQLRNRCSVALQRVELKIMERLRRPTRALTLVCSLLLGVGLFLALSVAAYSEEEFDINKVLWCESGKPTGKQTEAQCTEARELIMTNCTSCHAITPIVKAQKKPQQWQGTLTT